MGRKDVCAEISAPLSYFVFKNKLLIASDRYLYLFLGKID